MFLNSQVIYHTLQSLSIDCQKINVNNCNVTKIMKIGTVVPGYLVDILYRCTDNWYSVHQNLAYNKRKVRIS